MMGWSESMVRSLRTVPASVAVYPGSCAANADELAVVSAPRYVCGPVLPTALTLLLCVRGPYGKRTIWRYPYDLFPLLPGRWPESRS